MKALSPMGPLYVNKIQLMISFLECRYFNHYVRPLKWWCTGHESNYTLSLVPRRFISDSHVSDVYENFIYVIDLTCVYVYTIGLVRLVNLALLHKQVAVLQQLVVLDMYINII